MPSAQSVHLVSRSGFEPLLSHTHVKLFEVLGITLKGRWVGLSYDGKAMTGWGVMGRSEDEARSLIEELKESGG